MITASKLKELEGITEYFRSVPYDVTRESLYSAHELYAGFDRNDQTTFDTCFDTRVYKHFIAGGKRADLAVESLARTLHDHGIHLAMDEFFKTYDSHQCVGIMGGHAQLRTATSFRQVAVISKRLTELGFYMLSGGGPGAMEATHLGAWMAGRTEAELDDALSILSVAPSFQDEGWLATAMQVIERYPQEKGYVSLGVPTWLYGHEPTTPFATHIAKFFENSIREDSILTLAYGGIIYTPGSAGTMQEVFQDAVQNHYLSFGFSSPMIFVGRKFWTEEMPVYPFLQSMMDTGKYKNLLLTLTDTPDEILAALTRFRDQQK
jgi:predicted Rossmann-fold nucleotide-binding protein